MMICIHQEVSGTLADLVESLNLSVEEVVSIVYQPQVPDNKDKLSFPHLLE